MMERYEAYGEITIKFKYRVDAINGQNAIENAQNKFRHIVKLDGDIHLKNGNVLPLIAENIDVIFYDAVDDEML